MKVGETVVLPRPPRASPVSRGRGIDWNLESAEAFARGPLPGAAHDLASAISAGRAHGYVDANPYFGFADAAVAYALVRERRPGLVVEVGGGFSSRVLRTALDDAGCRGGRLVTIDPEPRADLTGVVSEHRKERVEDVPLAFFEELPADSVLFIDSSHRAGTGSDVNFLFLEVLPALAPGVLVHVHDVFLPEDYPFEWNAAGPFYTEQYLLHALLLFSRGFRVVWPGRQMLRERPALLAEALGAGVNLGLHGSFWLERTFSAPEAFPGPEG